MTRGEANLAANAVAGTARRYGYPRGPVEDVRDMNLSWNSLRARTVFRKLRAAADGDDSP